MNENIDNVVALADICKVLQGKNVDKKKTNEKKHGLPVVVGASDLHPSPTLENTFRSDKHFSSSLPPSLSLARLWR